MTDKEIKTLEQSAQKGDKKAAAQLNELGVDYQFGNNGQKVDLAQALHYYMIAAEGGNTNAMCNAAYCYATGAAGKVDAEKAFGLYQKAAEAGDLNGMTNLAGCYLNGFGTKQDAIEAIKWLVEALNAGAKNLQETLEQVFASLSPEDIKKFKQSGYSAAQYQMAEYCLKSKKSKDAISWYVQSYKSGKADAVTRMMTLADFLHRKNGQKEDLPFAYQLYEAAAECGDVEARTKVAYCLYNGIGIEKDTKRAFALYEQLANEGNEKGMANLGLIYCKGEGVQKDIQKAIYWSTRAAEELGSVNAMNTLTHIYGEEEGFINHEQAAKWFLELIKRDCDPNSGVYENTGYNKDLYEKIKDNVQYSMTEEDASNLEKAKALLREKTLILFRQSFINSIQIIRDNLLNELKDIPFTPGEDFDSTKKAQKEYLYNVVEKWKYLVKQGVSNVNKEIHIQSAIIKGFSYIGTYIQANLPTPLREIPFTPGVDDMQSAVQVVQDYIQRIITKTNDIVKENSSMLGYALSFTTSNAKSYINQAEEAIQRNIEYKEEQRRIAAEAEERARREREEKESPRERKERERKERLAQIADSYALKRDYKSLQRFLQEYPETIPFFTNYAPDWAFGIKIKNIFAKGKKESCSI